MIKSRAVVELKAIQTSLQRQLHVVTSVVDPMAEDYVWMDDDDISTKLANAIERARSEVLQAERAVEHLR